MLFCSVFYYAVQLGGSVDEMLKENEYENEISVN